MGFQNTEREWEAKSLNAGFRFGLAGDTVGLFPWWDRQTDDTGVAFHTNKASFHTTISRVWALEMLSL